ncbi:MAG: hypothetical protein DKT66_26585 [Candidatus Melainabacteria bacterium]|nr:MAG: hypothetical protein DKT66_26585 [Candidatus Melainabacteria bacterium]
MQTRAAEIQKGRYGPRCLPFADLSSDESQVTNFGEECSWFLRKKSRYLAVARVKAPIRAPQCKQQL